MLGLFFGGRGFTSSFGNEWGNVELDAVIEERHEWGVEPTQNPVEEGAPISDHILDLQDKLTITCFITDAPLNASSSMASLIGSIAGAVSGTPRPFDNRTQNAFDLLEQLLKLKMEMTVYTKHRTYDDMILTNVAIPRASSDGEALVFNAEFVHITKVATQIVEVPSGISAKRAAKAGGADGATAKKAEPQTNSGKRQAETVTKPSSTLSRIFN